ncbi:methyl-accepting chemotaxis protein [Chromatiaceae bacterium AAb-1]|nr:methyl-accepting chemotaxis protein [Chromatiaceae bacterium AAb-1]
MTQGKTLTVAGRLIWGFGIVLLLMLGLSLFSIQRVAYVNSTLKQISDVNAVKQRYAIDFRGSVHDRAIILRDVILLENTTGLQQAVADIAELDRKYQNARIPLDRIFGEQPSSLDKQLLERIHQQERHTTPLIKQVIDAKLAGNTPQATAILLQQARLAFIDWLASINAFIDYQEQQNQQETLKAHQLVNSFPVWLLGLNALALLIAMTIAWKTIRYLKSSLGGEPAEVAAIVGRIASGDLRPEITVSEPDSMLGAVISMQARLREVMDKVISAAAELSAGAVQLGHSSREALQATEQQAVASALSAGKIDEVSTGISGIAAIMQQTEQHSAQSVQLSEQGQLLVRNAAAEMNDVVKMVVSSAEKIGTLQQSSQQIAGIASVIRGIAEQTNLLALNAAIEAARAGESGRGFAVVADEVRKLAERTSHATTEIASMIQQVQDETLHSVQSMETAVPKVQQGLSLANDAAVMLQDIHRQAVHSLENVQEVTQVTARQSASATEIASHVEQIATMSRDTSDIMQQNSQVVSKLESIASVLKAQITMFRLN